jgi:cytochrome c
VSAKDFVRPKGTKIASGNRAKLIAEGKRLWHDKRLSTNDLSCNSCHANNASLNPTFAQPFPHRVAMAKQMANVDRVSADEMAQFCLLVPMQSKTLPWGSRELAALAAYTEELQKTFKYNPCAAKNPCNPCNPCAATKACNPCNPCAARKACSPCNPCAVKKSCNPCNPCAPKRNPCNPCNPCAIKKSS